MYRFSSNLMDMYDYEDKCQDQFICLKENITANNNYNEMNFGQLWISVINSYPDVVHLLMKYFHPFGSTYLHELAFSDMLTLKNKKHTRLDVEHDLRLCIYTIYMILNRTYPV